jgi:hypothetical protein
MPGDLKGTVFRKNQMGLYSGLGWTVYKLYIFWLSLKKHKDEKLRKAEHISFNNSPTWKIFSSFISLLDELD